MRLFLDLVTTPTPASWSLVSSFTPDMVSELRCLVDLELRVDTYKKDIVTHKVYHDEIGSLVQQAECDPDLTLVLAVNVDCESLLARTRGPPAGHHPPLTAPPPGTHAGTRGRGGA